MLKKIFKNKTIHRWALQFFVWLDNFCYVAITKLAIIDNNDVHPKHAIMNYHAFFVDHVTEEETVIDVGCSTGSIAYDVAAKAKKVVGIDFNEKSIRHAVKHYQRPNLSFIVGDATTYQFPERFDKIVLSNVLEHIEDRVAFLKKLHPISPVILLRVPMINRDWVTLYKQQKKLEYRLDPTHFTEFMLPQLISEVEAAGWKLGDYSMQFGELWGILRTGV